jgi:hypothetical protein
MTRLARIIGRTLLVAVLVVLAASYAAQPSDAQPSTTVPAITITRAEVSVGDRVQLTVSGFKAQIVTISICGNEARRGSPDCNLIDSKSLELHQDGTPSVTEMVVSAPPVGCPCAVRASSSTNDEVAVAPISLIGVPVAPVIGGPDLSAPLVAVSITTRPVPRGFGAWIRSNLGGATPYEVTVTVKNLTTDTLRRVKLSGSVGRGSNDILASLDLKDPGELAPGGSASQTVTAELPAPALGTFVWRVPASGAGVTVVGTNTMRPRPMLLIVLVLALVADVCVLAMRALARRRATRAESQSETQVVGQVDAGRDDARLVGSSI